MGRSIRTTLLVAAAAAGLAAAAGASAANPPANGEAALSRCIADNQYRYSQPDQAAVLQYIDIVALCRSILAQGTDVQVQVTPLGGSPASSTPSAVATPESTSGATATPTPAQKSQSDASGPTSVGKKADVRAARTSVAGVRAALSEHAPVRDAGLLGGGPYLRFALGIAVGITGAAMIVTLAARRRRR
jgi:hypothetical protein